MPTTRRCAGRLAIAQNQLLQLGGSASNFALNRNLPDIQTLFNNKNAALVANVGTLIEPTTRAQYLAGQTVPTNLFSHTDQQLEWQNAAQSGTVPSGWAGRIADTLNGDGEPERQGADDYVGRGRYAVLQRRGEYAGFGDAGQRGGRDLQRRHDRMRGAAGDRAGAAELQLRAEPGDGGQPDYFKRLCVCEDAESDAVQSVSPLKTVFPANGLGAQLAQIAQIIQVRAALGVTRQIFFAGIGNFDTHSDQVALQGQLLAGISPAIAAFYQATQELNVANNVTRLR